MFFWKTLLPRLHLFDQKYSENNNIVKCSYNLNIFLIIHAENYFNDYCFCGNDDLWLFDDFDE